MNDIKTNDLLAILNKITDGIIVTTPTGTVLFCNSAAASNYGVSKAKLLSTSIEYLTANGIVDQSLRQLAIDTKKTITYEQVCNSKKHLINKTIPVCDKNKNIQYIIEQTYGVENLMFDTNKHEIALPTSSNTPHTEKSDNEDMPMAEFKSKQMIEVYSLADNMASKNINILILGNSGTGKSQLAKRIHSNSKRKNGPFVTINCSTIPENLLESELFGYMKGAFSGANERGKQGLVEMADGGTLFLDEIGEISLNIQTKLLQLVQDKTYLPVGGVNPKHVDIRIVAATNKDLFQQVSDNLFREDLFYRLAVVTITMPSLKDRPEDIRKLINHFTHVFNHKHNMDVSFSRNTVDLLTNYSWPGNIRELEHLIEFLILNANGDYVTPYMLPTNILDSADPGLLKSNQSNITHTGNNTVDDCNTLIVEDEFDSLADFLNYYEGNYIKQMYSSYNSSYKMAERLKISQSKAARLIRKYIKERE